MSDDLKHLFEPSWSLSYPPDDQKEVPAMKTQESAFGSIDTTDPPFDGSSEAPEMKTWTPKHHDRFVMPMSEFCDIPRRELEDLAPAKFSLQDLIGLVSAARRAEYKLWCEYRRRREEQSPDAEYPDDHESWMEGEHLAEALIPFTCEDNYTPAIAARVAADRLNQPDRKNTDDSRP